MYEPNMPPAPPPKPVTTEDSRAATPGAMSMGMSMGSTSHSHTPSLGGQPSIRGPPPPPGPTQYQRQRQDESQCQQGEAETPDPGDNWLPLFLKDKSKKDLEALLKTSTLLNGLTNSPNTIHPSLDQSYQTVSAALDENIRTASQLLDLESQLSHQRASTQAQLLSTRSLERQWHQKQRDMDNALNPFSPSSLYQKVGQGLQDQEAICTSLEDNFLDGGFAGGGHDGVATERETLEWIRRYKDQKKLYYLRKESKARWDEGRVGGWR